MEKLEYVGYNSLFDLVDVFCKLGLIHEICDPKQVCIIL